MGAAATAAASAAMLSAQAAEDAARRAECQGVFGAFDPHGASLDAMRAYAKCVRDVHGLADPWTPEGLLAAKLAVLVALICVAAGLIWGWRDDGIPGAMLGAIGGVIAAVIMLAICVGLLFLVGAH